MNRFLTPVLLWAVALFTAADARAGTLLYVANSGSNSITGFDSAGNVAATINIPGSLNGPMGLAFAPNGDLFVSNARPNTNTLTRFSSASGYTTFSTISGGLNTPNSLAFAANGDLYVTNVGSNAIVRYSAVSDYTARLSDITTAGTRSGAIAISASQDLYVESGGRLYQFLASDGYSSSSNLLTSGTVFGMAFGPNDDLFFITTGVGMVRRVSAASGYTSSTVAISNLAVARGLAFGPGNDIYVSTALSNAVQRYNYDSSTDSYSFSNSISGGLTTPLGVAFGPAPVAVPEPSTLLMALPAALAIAGLRRRRNR